MNLNILLDPDHHRFKVTVEGKECILDFSQPSAKVLNYYHTYVPSELRGRGIASEIVNYAFHYAKENGLKIIPSCPYVRRYIALHPEWKTIVAP